MGTLNGRIVHTLGTLGLVTAVLGLAGGRQAQAAGPAAGHANVKACADVAAPGIARCFAHVRVDPEARSARPALPGSPGATATESAIAAGAIGNNGAYDPSYLRSAYNLASLSANGGVGQTVAIVDAYDDPTAESDLANYRSYFGLSACSSVSGCFRKVNENGATSPLPTADSGWSQEIALDLDMVSAICPNCNILLVEGNSAYFSDLGVAANTAAAMGARAISNSYGGGEYSGETSDEVSYYYHPGIAVTVSSGDNGYGVQFPASSQYVTAVGGTTLNQATNTGARNATETVWSGAGSGCSAYESKPSWQQDAGCGRRTVADVAAVADPNTGVWVYYHNGWYIFGGTSVASPIVGAVYALNGNPVDNAIDASFPYDNNHAYLFDITGGSNGSCSGSYLCTGVTGYDGPTGIGSPNGDAAFKTAQAPVATPNFTLATNPSSRTVTAGGSASYGLTLTAQNGYASAVNLSVSGLPAGAIGTFSPTSVTPMSSGAGSTLTINTTSSTPAATYTLTVTGAGTDAPANTTHTATVTLVVNAPVTGGFTITGPSSITQRRNTRGTYTITVSPTGGFTGPVALNVGGQALGVSASISPTSVTLNGSSATATLTVTTGGARGSLTLTITGTSGSTSASTSIPVTVIR